MRRLTLLFFLGLLLSGCVAALNGSVSTATYTKLPQGLSFTVVSPDSLSLTERNITALIEKKMAERGYIKASSRQAANVAVLYKYSVGSGRTEVSSSPDFVWGGQKVESTTVYPRFFQIVVVDLERSKIPEKIEILWQGEVYSSGSSENISKLASHLIDVLFANFGTTVTNKSFLKIVEW